MELEIYEAELADYSLQDSPFYEADTPIIFDYSMSAQTNLISAANLAAKNGLKLAHSTIFQQNGCDQTGNSFIGSDGISCGSGSSGGSLNSFNVMSNGIENGCNGTNSTNNASGILGSGLASGSGSGKKKNRKCVSFLPNYVQVSFYLFWFE